MFGRALRVLRREKLCLGRELLFAFERRSVGWEAWGSPSTTRCVVPLPRRRERMTTANSQSGPLPFTGEGDRRQAVEGGAACAGLPDVASCKPETQIEQVLDGPKSPLWQLGTLLRALQVVGWRKAVLGS